MKNTPIQITVAGHICLDIFPDFEKIKGDVSSFLIPGQLINVGPASVSTGGAVANTGLALHRLGISTRLIGKLGEDIFGESVLKILQSYDKHLTEEMIVEEGGCTSYTIVISPPQADRTFLHHSGANDTFKANDLPVEKIKTAKIFHFGYPPVMKQMYANDGAELKRLLERVRETGVILSLDMSKPDPDSEAGRVNWRIILKRVLPLVDIFLPSLDEITFMLQPKQSKNKEPNGHGISVIGEEMLHMGMGLAVIKLGNQGLYLKTAGDTERLRFLQRCGHRNLKAWTNRELLAPCFEVEVAGTTGAGDSTIAGFLAGLLKQQTPEEVMTTAVAVGACSVERVDATSGIPEWEIVQQRIQQEWKRLLIRLDLPGWRFMKDQHMWVGPGDQLYNEF